MSITKEQLARKVLASPRLRQNLLNKGTMYLYCDYAGFASRSVYGAACCIAYKGTVSLTAKKLPIDRDQGSSYGELMAIVLSLETLHAALLNNQPKIAVIFTDCSRIARLLVQDRFAHSHDEQGKDAVLTALAHLRHLFPAVDVQIKYMSKHKRNNDFHRLAHDAARQAAISSQSSTVLFDCLDLK